MQINKEHETETIKTSLKKNQKDWVKHFNNKNLKMVSAPDIYTTAKKGNKAIMDSLRKDFKDNYIITSTQIKYNKKTLMVIITHDVDSNVVKPKRIKVKIPDLSGDFKEDSTTEKYLQALFNTKDSLSIILKTLKKFDNKRTIRLWTPSQSQREDKQVRSVVLYFGDFGRFGVYADDWFDSSYGLSRGVIINSAKQSKSKRGNQKWN